MTEMIRRERIKKSVRSADLSARIGIFLGFFLAQLFIASRGWLKIAYFAAQARCSYLSEIHRAPAPAA